MLKICYTESMQEKIFPTSLRIPRDMLTQLKTVAQQNGRTMHGEMVWALRQHIAKYLGLVKDA
jgi:predicted DNA-binding protein